MNFVADLAANRERMESLGLQMSDQSARLARFRELRAPRAVIDQAARFLIYLEGRFEFALERELTLLRQVDRERSPTIEGLLLGLSATYCTVEELASMLDSAGVLPTEREPFTKPSRPERRLFAPARQNGSGVA